MVNMIRKQHTKEWIIDLKVAEIQSLQECIQPISSAENKVKAEMRKIEEDWRQVMLLEMERNLPE